MLGYFIPSGYPMKQVVRAEVGWVVTSLCQCCAFLVLFLCYKTIHFTCTYLRNVTSSYLYLYIYPKRGGGGGGGGTLMMWEALSGGVLLVATTQAKGIGKLGGYIVFSASVVPCVVCPCSIPACNQGTRMDSCVGTNSHLHTHTHTQTHTHTHT